MGSPYVETAGLYWAAGWRGVLPLPANAKGPVPRGYTGWAGVEPSWPDVMTWIESGVGRYAAGNIALRLPRGVYGLDVDAYGNKGGAAALAALESTLGALPATWCVSSRDDGISGIRLFRGDPGPDRRWRDEPGGHGAGIEAIHFGHRYAVTYPSVHPETGAKYVFRGTGGLHVEIDEIPRIGQLPELPAAWVEALSEPGEVRIGDMAGHREAVELIGEWRSGEPCRVVAAAVGRGVEGLNRAVDGAALHPAARDAVHELINLGHEGHVGVSRAVSEHGRAFIDIRTARGVAGGEREAGAEWWRLVRGAVGKLLPGNRAEFCDCDLWAGDGLDFTPEATAAWLADWALMDPAPVEVVEAAIAGGVDVVDDGSPVSLMRRQLVRASDMARRPAPMPIVAGLLFRDTLAWMIGRSGSFKSFVALDIAAHVAADKPWAGRRVWGGPVAYVVAEGAGGMSLRVRAWEEVNGPISDQLVMLPRAVQITGPEWPVLVEVLAEIRPVLVVIDTQARSTVGVKENDNAEMGAMIERLAWLKDATRACVLPVHHIGRQGEDARGASAIDGAQDTELKVSRKGGPKDLKATLTIDKQKDASDAGDIEITARLVDLGPDPLTGEPLSSLVTTPDAFGDPFPRAPWESADLTPIKAAILRNLSEAFDPDQGALGSKVLTLVNEQMPGRKYASSTFYRAWRQLAEAGSIEQTARRDHFRVVEMPPFAIPKG